MRLRCDASTAVPISAPYSLSAGSATLEDGCPLLLPSSVHSTLQLNELALHCDIEEQQPTPDSYNSDYDAFHPGTRFI